MIIDEEIKDAFYNRALSDVLLDELKLLRARAGIRVSLILDQSGKILSIHEDPAYVPKKMRHGERHQHIDKDYLSKWIISITRTVEFVSERLFVSGINIMMFEGINKERAIIVNMRDADPNISFLLMGILAINGSIGLGYQEIKKSAERIREILIKFRKNR